MQNSKANRHMIDFLFVLTLFFVFALSALTLVTLGANTYQNTVTHMEQNFNSRTVSSYITQRFRAYDGSHQITLTNFHDTEALAFYQTVNNTEYVTYMYVYEDSLCELLTRADQTLGPEAGHKIIEISDCNFSQPYKNLFCVDVITSSGESIHLVLSSHSESEVS